MRIKFLKNYDEHRKGAVVPVEEPAGKRLIEIGIAEQAPEDDPILSLADTIKTAVAQGFAAGAAEVVSTKAYGGQHPANADIRPGESEADRRKCLADQVKWITIAQCHNTYPGRQREAQEHLEKVYGSSFRVFDKKDLAEGSGTTGGYTVAPDYGKELLQLAREESIVRPFSNNKKLPAREAYYPMLNQTFVPSGTQGAPQSAYYGGVKMTWSGEAQPGTPTEPTFKQVHIVTNELQGLTKISRFLLSDSFISLDSELKSLFSGAIAYAEDYAFLAGDGVAKPKGILQSPATITYATRATANQFKLVDAANVMGAMTPQSRPKSVWVMTNNLFSQLVQLVDASGRVTYIPNVGTGYNEAKLAMGQLLLFGRPVLFTEKLPPLGTTGDVLLADFSKYITADTGSLEIAASDQYAFNTNQITYRIIERVDGQAQIDAPFTQQDGTTKTSPFVILSSSTT
ncbi:phage major capsid protein [Singulisphaera sp. Ch08]|uniref:Phage major capsid protein n=1 Tax=Singulisphaera sp. Ch08 TaxID=3120278 RepID=A0AAU7CNA0_9BACT